MKSLSLFSKEINPQHLKLSLKGIVQKIEPKEKPKEEPITNHNISESYQRDLKRK